MPTMQRKAYASQLDAIAERQVRVVCSTPLVDRAGEVVVQEGIDTAAYLQNPVVLFAHDPAQPIARVAQMGLDGGNLMATVQFPDAGISVKADEVYGLVKAGVLNTVSIGFQPTELLAMDPEQPRGPQRYMKSELLELSFVSVPANRGATVVARAHRAGAGVVVRSLYDVGCLASLLSELGWVQSSAVWDAEISGGGSQVPAMLGTAMQQLGAALIAMTEEEVAALLADTLADASDVASLPASDVMLVEAAATPAIRKFRAGWVRARGPAAQAVPSKYAVVTRDVPCTLAARAKRARAATVAALG